MIFFNFHIVWIMFNLNSWVNIDHDRIIGLHVLSLRKEWLKGTL